MNNINQRQHERFNVSLEGAFSSGSFVCSNAIVNISLGGLCMECGKPLEQYQELNVILPTRPPVKVNGRVAWCRKDGLSYQIGIKFEGLNKEQKRAVTELISSLFWQRESHRG